MGNTVLALSVTHFVQKLWILCALLKAAVAMRQAASTVFLKQLAQLRCRNVAILPHCENSLRFSGGSSSGKGRRDSICGMLIPAIATGASVDPAVLCPCGREHFRHFNAPPDRFALNECCRGLPNSCTQQFRALRSHMDRLQHLLQPSLPKVPGCCSTRLARRGRLPDPCSFSLLTERRSA